MNLIGFISQFSNLILKSKVRVFKIFGELLISPPRCWNNCDFNRERIKGIKREDKDGEEAFDLCEDKNFSKRNKYKRRITYIPSNLTTITN